MRSRPLTLLALAAGVLLLFACGKSQQGGGSLAISGAGATFPAPVYARWADDYHTASGVTLNYQSIGSGGGIKQVQANTVEFGASDMPLTQEELDKAGLYQFPTVMGGVVPLMNLPGVLPGQMKLTGAVLADIFLGAVKTWADPKIVALNPGLKLPQLPITVVHRADGSGTTFLFTTYLAARSLDWAAKAGANDAIEWPVGIGGKGNNGVAAFVQQTPGAIGYVEYAYAKHNNLPYAALQNHDGQFVTPSTEAFAAAAAGADWGRAPGNYLLLIDQPGAQAWPITGATFILLHRQQARPAEGKAVLSFFDWAYKNGDDAAAKLDYAPLPATVKDLVRKQWADVRGPDGQAVYSGG